jgi:phage tail sheath protein FI
MMIEQSLEGGLQWVTFEPNGPALWAQVRFQVETFLLTLWREGALFGPKPEHGFFVRCDPTTTTSEDLGAGFLVCEVGLALLRPAEFTVLLLRLATADAG